MRNKFKNGLEQFTYADIKRTAARNDMLSNKISSIGTQSGGFGLYQEHARVITLSGAESLANELVNAIGIGGVNSLMEQSNILSCIIEGCVSENHSQHGDAKNQMDLLGE